MPFRGYPVFVWMKENESVSRIIEQNVYHKRRKKRMRYKPFTSLSKNVLCAQKGKRFTIVSIPQGMEVTEDGNFIMTQKTPTIAVLDGFYEEQKIVSGVISTHGELVTKYAVNGLEDRVGVLACNVHRDSSIQYNAPPSTETVPVPIHEALQFLIRVQRKYRNIVAVNMSIEYAATANYFHEEWSLNISKENKKDLLESVRLDGIIYDKNLLFGPSYRIIQSINELIGLGVDVYVATGNDDDSNLNLFNLSNAHAVSSCDTTKDNELLGTTEAPGTHIFRKKFDITGKLQYITDGMIRFYPDEIDIRPRIGLLDIIFPRHRIWGTSFACPIKLNEDVKAKLKIIERKENNEYA